MHQLAPRVSFGSIKHQPVRKETLDDGDLQMLADFVHHGIRQGIYPNIVDAKTRDEVLDFLRGIASKCEFRHDEPASGRDTTKVAAAHGLHGARSRGRVCDSLAGHFRFCPARNRASDVRRPQEASGSGTWCGHPRQRHQDDFAAVLQPDREVPRKQSGASRHAPDARVLFDESILQRSRFAPVPRPFRQGGFGESRLHPSTWNNNLRYPASHHKFN